MQPANLLPQQHWLACTSSTMSYTQACTRHPPLPASQARLETLQCLDALPELYPRSLQRIAAGAASAAAARPATKLGLHSPGVPGLGKVLGLAQPRHSAPGLQGPDHTRAEPSTPAAGAAAAAAPPPSEARTPVPAPAAADPALPFPAQALTFMQRARALALMNWECEELGVPDGSGPGHAPPHAQPSVFWPSNNAYELAHLVGPLPGSQGQVRGVHCCGVCYTETSVRWGKVVLQLGCGTCASREPGRGENWCSE